MRGIGIKDVQIISTFSLLGFSCRDIAKIMQALDTSRHWAKSTIHYILKGGRNNGVTRRVSC